MRRVAPSLRVRMDNDWIDGGSLPMYYGRERYCAQSGARSLPSRVGCMRTMLNTVNTHHGRTGSTMHCMVPNLWENRRYYAPHGLPLSTMVGG